MDKDLDTATETLVLLSDQMTQAEIEVRLAIAGYLIPDLLELRPGAKLSMHWSPSFKIAIRTTSC
ncbi:hypothetical protein ACM7LV_00440 [Pseudomonas aeruginosa]|uniref:hypothetical protein n=1 Tax=Pseudomonas aeruginosa TaxID=287 RepID=UPI001CD25233|nr:hypothetical protein [Pseudomonas aeruginosa]MDP5588931.1 hypothetical protein [Pseudomonas aeruginosa]WGX20029.1 hypothetical protein P7I81_14825 [Pseudomonas aeruginosa]